MWSLSGWGVDDIGGERAAGEAFGEQKWNYLVPVAAIMPQTARWCAGRFPIEKEVFRCRFVWFAYVFCVWGSSRTPCGPPGLRSAVGRLLDRGQADGDRSEAGEAPMDLFHLYACHSDANNRRANQGQDQASVTTDAEGQLRSERKFVRMRVARP